jgi:hypothetical protein
MNNTSSNTTSITDIIVNKLESLVTMPIYYLVIAGGIVLLIILCTCCFCKKTVVVETVKEVEVLASMPASVPASMPASVPITVQEPIIIGRVSRARDMGRRRYNSSSGSEV